MVRLDQGFSIALRYIGAAALVAPLVARMGGMDDDDRLALLAALDICDHCGRQMDGRGCQCWNDE